MLAHHCSILTSIYNIHLYKKKTDVITSLFPEWDNLIYIIKHYLNSRNAGEYT